MVPTSMSDAEFPAGSWEVSPANLAFVEELYLAYLEDPAAVDETWRARFETLTAVGPADAYRGPKSINGNPPSHATINGSAHAPANGTPASSGNYCAAFHAALHAPAQAHHTPAAAARPTHPVDHRPERHHDARPARRDVSDDLLTAELASVAARRAIAGKRVRRLIEDY